LAYERRFPSQTRRFAPSISQFAQRIIGDGRLTPDFREEEKRLASNQAYIPYSELAQQVRDHGDVYSIPEGIANVVGDVAGAYFARKAAEAKAERERQEKQEKGEGALALAEALVGARDTGLTTQLLGDRAQTAFPSGAQASQPVQQLASVERGEGIGDEIQRAQRAWSPLDAEQRAGVSIRQLAQQFPELAAQHAGSIYEASQSVEPPPVEWGDPTVVLVDGEPTTQRFRKGVFEGKTLPDVTLPPDELTGGALKENQYRTWMRQAGYDEEQIDRLAPLLAAGGVTVDNFTGRVRNRARELEAPRGDSQQLTEAPPIPEEPTTPDGAPSTDVLPLPDITDAAGFRGFATNIANTLWDAFGAEPLSPENLAATTSLENLKANWQIAMMRAIPGRTAVDIREMTSGMFPNPNEIRTGRSRVKSKFEANFRFLEKEIQRINTDVLGQEGQQTFSRKQLADAELNRDELQGLADMIGELVGQFDKKDQTKSEPSSSAEANKILKDLGLVN
jgi:hypothetical protein